MKKVAFGIMLALFLICMLALAISIKNVKSEPKTIIVPDDYSTIQEAIDNANAGDTVYVKAGIYYEHVVVNKTLMLIGEIRETTIIDANGTATAVEIECSFVTFKGFTVRNAVAGIYLSERAIQNTVENNLVINNIEGIWIITAHQMSYGENHVIKNNIIANNVYGLRLSGCEYNAIFQNKIKNNTEVGIMLEVHPTQYPERRGSHNNLIFQNVITENKIGIYIVGENNVIYHNNFINNTKNVHVYNITSYNNFWDNGYPSGGNYWSDYAGVDLYSGPYQNITGSDGISDTPYIIDENNVDNYPLMGPFRSFNTSVGYSVDVISNSTIENFQYFESNSTIRMVVSNMTANQTTGFCRLTIPHELMAPPYNITLNNTPIEYDTIFEDETLSIIYFTYQHSPIEIVIIPEFS
ncbi:MAG: pectinesterase family protein [Candidatus Bathyarchaeota archaeon]|jgi:parallel beta-helix repeat protein|nr:pectinesterase family protein [Candidatus Bathyarchaeota archaeon]